MAGASPTFGRGLSRVPRDVLEALLRSAVRGHLPLPVTRAGLLVSGFGSYEADLDALIGLDERALRVAIRVALDERDAGTLRAAVLGDDPSPGPADEPPRDGMDGVVAAIVAAAREDVLVAHHAGPSPALRDALSTARAAGAHVVWVAAPPPAASVPGIDAVAALGSGSVEPGAAPPAAVALPSGVDRWLPPRGAPVRTACIVLDGRVALVGVPVPGPALRIDDPVLARSLRARWRSILASDGYTLEVG
jgi:hypothetical protein